MTISFWIKISQPTPGYSQIFSKDNGYAGGGAAIEMKIVLVDILI